MIAVAVACLIAAGTSPDSGKAQDEYVAKLSSTDPTADAHFKLAAWARRHKMNDVADGHLRTAVYLDSKFAPAQKALGRNFLDGVWESKEEHRARIQREESLRNERDHWLRKLKEVGVEAATEQGPLTDASMAAIEAFAFRDASRASAAVRIFSDSSLGSATLGLMRLAVASPFPHVRVAASKALIDRNPDHYLVALLEFVKPRPAGKSVVLGVGEIWYWQEAETMFVAMPARDSSTAGSRRVGVEHHDLEQRMADRQFETDRLRANAISALQVVTGKKIGDDFAEWRKTVALITQSFIDPKQAKPTTFATTYYQPETITVGTYLHPVLTYRDVKMSCFAAGTPVVTKHGVIPIDQVCIGELVLSRNVETGETAYKPVLARTLRPRVPMQKLTVGEEALFSTAGHPFWTPDKGWTKAKNLSQGLSLGIEDGEVKLSAVAEAEEPQQAYNLVVADFGTYFVGKSRILVHDNTPIRDAPAKVK